MATELTFATGCVFTRDEDGTLSIEWDNGNAMNAITGATLDYIAQHFRVAGDVHQATFTYRPDVDVARMMAGGVPFKLAFIVMAMRKSVFSQESAVINLVETYTVQGGDAAVQIPQADWDVLVDHADSVKAIVMQAFTILGLNGLSILSKGHHYRDDDSQWERLNTAAGLDEAFAEIGVSNWEGTVFHHALHPLDLMWKVNLVVHANSPLHGHVHGVLTKRMPGVPAGTAVISAALAAISEVTILRHNAIALLNQFRLMLLNLMEHIRAAPLDWCSHFQRANTGHNLDLVTRLEPVCAFVYGMATSLLDRRASVLKARALKSASGRNPAMTALGREYAESLPVAPVDDATVAGILATPVAQVAELIADLQQAPQLQFIFADGNINTADDEDDEDDDDEDANQGPAPGNFPGGNPAQAAAQEGVFD